MLKASEITEMEKPEDFLNIIYHAPSEIGDDVALCAGFERGEWRNEQLADHVMEWLPEFALNHSELNELGHHNAMRMIKKAARIIYTTEKYGLRGEFGEILLHIAIRQIYQTIPAVSKIYYKSSVNKTVEGFDAVHIVKSDEGLELWIGETKFYNEVGRAIRDVCEEIVDHLETDYLRSEFLLITNKIDPTWPEAEKLKSLLSGNLSLDEVFERACIPVLLTYDSDAVNASKATGEDYLRLVNSELNVAFSKMRDRLSTQYVGRYKTELPITVHVMMIPLRQKKALIDALDKKLKALQA